MGDEFDTPDRPRYRLLGPVTAYGSTGQLGLGGLKQRGVLAVLLLNANQMVAEQRLFDLVWGASPPRSVKGRLQVHISELRALLGQDVILRVGGGYLVKVAPHELDLHVFADAVAQAQAELSVGRAESAARQLRAALALWNGPALGGVTQALYERERPILDERRLSAVEDLFDAELAAGRHAQVTGELRAAWAGHPSRERLAAQLMLALNRGERRQEALTVYTDIHRRLIDELGIEPGRRLQNMRLRILSNQDHKAPEIGEDRTTSEQSATEWSPPAELPRDISGFTGRGDALGTLGRYLHDGGVCVINGMAGIGKTALAVHWANSVREHFPDGQLYINLQGYDPNRAPLTPSVALKQLLRSLRVYPTDLRDDPRELAARYRSSFAGRRMLVLLDNARDASQVLPLLPPSGAVVVTSRHRLGNLIAQVGARTMSLATLTRRESHDLLESMLGPDRLAAEPDSVAELSRLYGGLPLALRLAAAHLEANPSQSIANFAAELADGDRLGALALDGAEHSVFGTAISGSYQALEPDQQRFFRLLGLIPGNEFTAAAAAALTAIPIDDASRHLSTLATGHLVEQHTPKLYRFHNLVRAYAAAQAHSDPERRSA